MACPCDRKSEKEKKKKAMSKITQVLKNNFKIRMLIAHIKKAYDGQKYRHTLIIGWLCYLKKVYIKHSDKMMSIHQLPGGRDHYLSLQVLESYNWIS